MVFGILSIGYYVLICLYLRRWNSRFPRFWLAAGCISILFACQKEQIPEEVLAAIVRIFSLLMLAFIVIEMLVIYGMQQRKALWECEYLIVLGAKVDGKNLTDALRQRLDCAVAYLKKHKNCRVVVSGGQGHGELITEAEAMATYLKKCGIEEKRILKEDKSTTTRENLKFSGELILEKEKKSIEELKVGIVTNSFHVFRAECIAKQEGYQKVLMLSAPTTKIMLPNYMVREFFGVIKMLTNRLPML